MFLVKGPSASALQVTNLQRVYKVQNMSSSKIASHFHMYQQKYQNFGCNLVEYQLFFKSRFNFLSCGFFLVNSTVRSTIYFMESLCLCDSRMNCQNSYVSFLPNVLEQRRRKTNNRYVVKREDAFWHPKCRIKCILSRLQC